MHIADDKVHTLDPLGAAKLLAAAIEREKQTGADRLQSDAHGFGQTGVLLADRLGLPHATLIMQIGVEGDHLRVKRELRLDGSNGSSFRFPLFDDSVRHQQGPVRDAQRDHVAKKKKSRRSRGSLGVTHEPRSASSDLRADQTKKTEF